MPSDLATIHAGAGNAALATAATGGSLPPAPSIALLQSTIGNAAVAAAGTTLERGSPRGASLQPSQRRGTALARVDPQTRLSRIAERLRVEALPAFQRGLDAVDATVLEDAGTHALALWAAVEGANAEPRPPEAIRAPNPPELPAFVEIRDAVLAGVTIQRFRGEDLLGPPRPIKYVVDVGRHIATQTREAVATAKDARELVRRLGGRELSLEDEEAVIRLLAGHPSPWQFAYLLAVIRGQGLEPALQALGLSAAEDLRAILASQEFLKKRAALGPADRIGIVEPVPAERKVRVLRPYGARELALELYGDYSFYETLLVPYNRTQLGNLTPIALVPAGTELLIEPRLVHGRYRLVFMAMEMTRRQADRPYIDANPTGAAIVGTKSRYTLRWPSVPPPPTPWETSGGLRLWMPLSQLAEWVQVEWLIDNDPGAVGVSGVAAEDWLGSRSVMTPDLTKDGSGVDWSWKALGTHTVRCKVTFPGSVVIEPIELRYPQPVVEEREKLEAEWPTVEDPRIDPSLIFAERAETYGDFQRIAAELGVTEDELAHDPTLAGKVRTSYYPEFLLRDLRQQFGMANAYHRRKLQYQIDAVEKAIAEAKTWGLRPIRALYVSADEKRTFSTPLTLYLSPDPDAAAAFHFALKLWDFTLEGSGHQYTDGHGAWNPAMAVHGLLDAFGKQAPYPKGTVRFVIDSSLLPEAFAGKYPLASELYEVHTDGGLLIEKLAAGIVTLAAVGVGSLVLGPEVALTAFAVYGAITGLADIVERLEAGTFDWDIQTGLDILAIAGGLAVGISPVISAVRGVGAVAWLGATARAAGYLQLGVMAGHHLGAILVAIDSGDPDKLLEAVLAAAIDGALVVVTHKAGSMSEEAQGRAREPVPEGGLKGVGATLGERAGGRPSTAVGIGGGDRPTGPPPSQEPAPAPREGSPRAIHEEWAGRVAERGLSPRPGPGKPAGPPVSTGTYETMAGERSFKTPEAAFAAYDETLTRAGGREVGVFRNVDSPVGEYVVRVGNELSVWAPEGNWESVLHKHPNPENVLTRRMPAPQDVQGTRLAAFQSRRAVTEFIDYPMPDGRHALVAYTVEPARGRVTIKYEGADGKIVERTFASVEAYASHYAERTTYVDPGSPEYQWMMQDLHEFYADQPFTGGATARGVLKSAAAGETPSIEGVIRRPRAGKGARSSTAPRAGQRPTPGEPIVRTRAQLDRATQALEQRLETLKSHPDAGDMSAELDLIKAELRGDREADASTRLTELERRVARAQLTQASGGLELIYGQSERVLGSRVIEYVPTAEGPPLKLDTTTPHPLDTTGQKLLAHVRAAIAQAEAEGFTEAEAAALRSVERSGRSALRDAFRGSHIDRLAKRAVMEDPELEHVYATVNYERGADFFDSRTGQWYDITTAKAWKQHVLKYGPDQPGKTTVPGFRLPTETQ